MNKYKARWENAKKMHQSVNDLLDKGFIVFNSEMEAATRYTITESQITRNLSENSTVLEYENDKDFDHGCHETIKEHNKKFEGWKIINPKDIQEFLK